jgi:site-specific DNA-methyltransferase (adenine-specific)
MGETMKHSLIIQGDAAHLPLADNSVSLTFTSPPYADARTYGIGAQRSAHEWVAWMLDVVAELTRVTTGLVLVNCAGVTRDRNYWPCCEGLLWEWFSRGGQCWRPCYWKRVGIPGSGGKQWMRADIEYILCFKRDAEWLGWSDNTANGHPPKWGPGGEMSYRLSDGARVNDKNGERKGAIRPSHKTVWGNRASAAGRRADGTMKVPHMRDQRKVDENNRLERGNEKGRVISSTVLANPGNYIEVDFTETEIAWHEQATEAIKVNVGGGLMGHPLAHKNEAPFPQALAEWFIRSFCPPNGIVFDPFSGSGTTVAAALNLGRRAIGLDLRMNQCALGRERVATPNRGHASAPKPDADQQVLWK